MLKVTTALCLGRVSQFVGSFLIFSLSHHFLLSLSLPRCVSFSPSLTISFSDSYSLSVCPSVSFYVRVCVSLSRSVFVSVSHLLSVSRSLCLSVHQRLHDQAIERRTNLKVETEAEHQKQDLIDSKLLNEQHRSVLRESVLIREHGHNILDP